MSEDSSCATVPGGDAHDLYRAIEGRLTGPEALFAIEDAVHVGRHVRAYRHRAGSAAAIFARAQIDHGDCVLIHEGDRTSTYFEVVDRTRRLASALARDHDVGPGTLVGIVMRNRTEWFAGFMAVQWLGAVAVLLNSRAAADELAGALADVPCAIILADDKLRERLHEGGVLTPILSLAEQDAAIASAEPADQPGDAPPDASAAILFTSGTTGRPKGAVLTQFNLTNMAMNLKYSHAINSELAAALMGVRVETLLRGRPPAVGLLIAPLFHLSGLSVLFSTLSAGGSLVILPRWDAQAAMDLIAEHAITSFTGPPMVLSDLIERPGAAHKLATIGSFSVAGQATPAALLDKVRAVLPRAGPSTGWGGTETCGSVAVGSGPVLAASPASAGVALPVSTLSIRDEDGTVLPAGAIGEIWVHGALVMKGYWNRPEATADAISDGWYRSGDIGTIDARGYLTIVDRLKDMVISAGENIYCAEVERVIGTDPAVREVAMFGVPDARLGERAIVAVNLEPAASRSDDDIRRHARGSLADYKVPQVVVFDLGAFPRNVMDKVDKAKLRARYLERCEGALS